MRRLVIVVIPVRNGVRHLAEAIDSVLANAAGEVSADIEVIVVDNCSIDGSRSLAESYGPPVRVIGEAQRGAAHARNAGVKLAEGEYLAFLDADDVWRPAKLDRQLRELEARRDLDIVFCFGENFLSPELTEAERGAVVCRRGVGPFILPSAMLARRDSFIRAGPLPDLLEGEFIAWYGMALSMGMRSDVIPEALLLRRVHLTNSTRQAAHPADLLRAAKMVLDRKKRQ